MEIIIMMIFFLPQFVRYTLEFVMIVEAKINMEMNNKKVNLTREKEITINTGLV